MTARQDLRIELADFLCEYRKKITNLIDCNLPGDWYQDCDSCGEETLITCSSGDIDCINLTDEILNNIIEDLHSDAQLEYLAIIGERARTILDNKPTQSTNFKQFDYAMKGV